MHNPCWVVILLLALLFVACSSNAEEGGFQWRSTVSLSQASVTVRVDAWEKDSLRVRISNSGQIVDVPPVQVRHSILLLYYCCRAIEYINILFLFSSSLKALLPTPSTSNQLLIERTYVLVTLPPLRITAVHNILLLQNSHL